MPVCQNRIELNACFDPGSSMTEFAKIASAIKMWGWGRTWMVLAAVLLLKHVVTFDQALILIFFNVGMDRFVYGKQPSPRPQNRSSAATAKNRRRPKLLQPIKVRPVGADGGLAAARRPEPHSRNNGAHRELGARHIESASTNK